jgi:hypothetical protein
MFIYNFALFSSEELTFEACLSILDAPCMSEAVGEIIFYIFTVLFCNTTF